jgi:hypothetical protein
VEHDPLPKLFVFIDNYDEFTETLSHKTDLKRFGQLARQQRDRGLHFVLSGSPNILFGNDELCKQVEQSRMGFALRTSDAVEALFGKMPQGLINVDLPAGCGFLIDTGDTRLVQIGTMEPTSASRQTYAMVMDEMIDTIIDRWSEKHYRWHIDFKPPSEDERNNTPPSESN